MLCGIEIHQRLAGRKLFCACLPAGGEGAPACFSRRLHAVRSEMGELDSAVRMESIRERAFEYIAPENAACLVEADEEPPHSINGEALHAVLCICSLLGSRAVDELHVMRKTVIDGSNTAGFQRTALAALGGSIQTPSGSLGIQSVCIEEESAGILEGGAGKAKYSLDRLGIPLVEIATAPDLRSGKEAQEAALAIGTLLRKTGMVSRGIGTIRQDLNVSTEKGARVEIKGVQELSMVAKTVELEVERQEKILALMEKAKSRLGSRKIGGKFVDLTDIFSETRSPLVSKMLKSGARALGLSLPGFEGLLGQEVNPGRRLGSELADYARSTGVKGLIHSDEQVESYGISEDELAEVKVALSLSKDDAFAIVLAPEQKAASALSEVARRASFFGVMEETRKANPDGTSSYMRPLPGRARMYPETDVPRVPITKEMLLGVEKTVKELASAQEEKEEALSSLPPELASQLSAAKGLLAPSEKQKPGATPEISAFFLSQGAGIDAKLAASALTNTLASIRREGAQTQALTPERFVSALLSVKQGVIAKAALPEVLKALCSDPSATPQSAAKQLCLEKITGAALQKLIADEKPDFAALMAKYRLRVDAQEAKGLFGKKG